MELEPVVDGWVRLLGPIRRQHAFTEASVRIILAGAEAVDRVVDHRLDAGLLQRRYHPHVERRLGREQHRGGFDAERVADDAPVPLDLLDDVPLRDQRHQRVIEAEGGEVAARIAKRRVVTRDRPQGAVPAGEAAAALAVSGAALELLDQRAAPAGREPGVRQIAGYVLTDRRRDEVGVITGTRAEDAVLLAVPIGRVRGVVVRLVHVLVDAEVEPHLRGIWADGDARSAQRTRRRLDP